MDEYRRARIRDALTAYSVSVLFGVIPLILLLLGRYIRATGDDFSTELTALIHQGELFVVAPLIALTAVGAAGRALYRTCSGLFTAVTALLVSTLSLGLWVLVRLGDPPNPDKVEFLSYGFVVASVLLAPAVVVMGASEDARRAIAAP